MRDPLDGIKTKQGRVVYDRKKHKFITKDLLRIVKVVDLHQEWSAQKDECQMVDRIHLVVGDLIAFLNFHKEMKCVQDTLENIRLSVTKPTFDFGRTGSDPGFGGGGATRTDL